MSSGIGPATPARATRPGIGDSIDRQSRTTEANVQPLPARATIINSHFPYPNNTRIAHLFLLVVIPAPFRPEPRRSHATR